MRGTIRRWYAFVHNWRDGRCPVPLFFFCSRFAVRSAGRSRRLRSRFAQRSVYRKKWDGTAPVPPKETAAGFRRAAVWELISGSSRLLIFVFRLGVRRNGFAMDVVARTLQMVDPLVAPEGGIARITRPRVLGLFRFRSLGDVILILVVGVVVGFYARVRRGRSSEGRVTGTSLKICPLVLSE